MYLTLFFRGQPISKFERISGHFAINRIPGMIRSDAAIALEEHKKKQDKIVIVSSSLENWLAGWCHLENFDLIGTKLETLNGFITGKLHGENCYGPEKVNRLKEKYHLEDYSEIIVYGNSKGDLNLYEISTRYFHKTFEM